jgi:uncharacterized protein YjiS (DUF1127 family)
MKTLVYKFVTAAQHWHRRQIAIRELAALSNGTLRDIGLHRSELGSMATELSSPAPTRLHAMTQSTAIMGMQDTVQHAVNDEHFETAA